jgi:heat shock factor-binding protein 1
MQDRFEDMSSNIVGRIDEMGKRIDDIEKSIEDVMKDLGESEEDKIPYNAEIKIK